MQRKEWSEALLRTSKQATLNFGSNSFGMSYDAQGRKTHQMSRVLAESLSVIGESIRLTPAFYDLFCRLALILHRTTYITATASAKGKGKASNLTSSLLARFGKRAYPSYKVQRTSVFPSRLLLVKFESALALEAKMVDLLELPGSREERRLRWIEGVNIARDVHDDWRAAVKECKKRDQDFEYYKLRFHPGWAWTRVLHKAVRMHASLVRPPPFALSPSLTALSGKGNHAAEIEILTDLLAPDQPFRKGKRGAWADRLALVTMHYPTSLEEKCKDEKAKDKMKRKRLKRAKAIVEHALQDGRTHISPFALYLSLLQLTSVCSLCAAAFEAPCTLAQNARSRPARHCRTAQGVHARHGRHATRRRRARQALDLARERRRRGRRRSARARRLPQARLARPTRRDRRALHARAPLTRTLMRS